MGEGCWSLKEREREERVERKKRRAARNVDQLVQRSLHLVSENHLGSHSACTFDSQLTPFASPISNFPLQPSPAPSLLPRPTSPPKSSLLPPSTRPFPLALKDDLLSSLRQHARHLDSNRRSNVGLSSVHLQVPNQKTGQLRPSPSLPPRLVRPFELPTHVVFLSAFWNQVTQRTKLKRKEVDDVLGGAEAWDNVDRTEGQLLTFLLPSPPLPCFLVADFLCSLFCFACTQPAARNATTPKRSGCSFRSGVLMSP